MGNICEIFSKNKNINNDEIINPIPSTYIIHNKVDISDNILIYSSLDDQLPSYSELYSNNEKDSYNTTNMTTEFSGGMLRENTLYKDLIYHYK